MYRGVIVAIVAIIGISMIGTGYLSGNNNDYDKNWFNKYWDDNNNWLKKYWDDLNFKKFMGFMNSGGGDDDDDKCDCEDRKKDHKEHYDSYKKYFDDHNKKFDKGDYKKYLDDYKKYFDNNREGFDKTDFKQYMDYYKKYLEDNKKSFDKDDYNKYDKEYKKYTDEYPKHDDHCKCMDDNDDHTMIDHAIINFDIIQRELKDNNQIYYQNIVDKCIFESEDSFSPLCIKCKFLKSQNNIDTIVATGEVIKLDKSYTAHTELPIPMSPVPWAAPYTPVANDVQNVDKVELTICGFKDKCPDDHDKCKCDERKKDHKKHYDDFDKYYKDNKKKFGKSEYSKYMDDYEKYMDDEGKYMDKSDYKMFMDYHGKFLNDNKNSFSSSDHKKHSSEHEKHSKDYPKHDDDQDDECKEKSGFFVGGGRVDDPKYGKVTHGFELHCDATQAPNNLEINWLQNKFHLEELESAKCIDNRTPNEPPPSPHPGPTLDIYKGEGFGRYNGVCGAYATWVMDDNGEPAKNDQILSLKIKDEKGKTVLDITNPLKLQTGNHQFVPHQSQHPHPPQTNPCPQITP